MVQFDTTLTLCPSLPKSWLVISNDHLELFWFTDLRTFFIASPLVDHINIAYERKRISRSNDRKYVCVRKTASKAQWLRSRRRSLFFLQGARGEHAIGRGATTPFLPLRACAFSTFLEKKPGAWSAGYFNCLSILLQIGVMGRIFERAGSVYFSRKTKLTVVTSSVRQIHTKLNKWGLVLTGVWIGLNAELSTGVNSCKIWNLSEIFGHKRIAVYGQRLCK